MGVGFHSSLWQADNTNRQAKFTTEETFRLHTTCLSYQNNANQSLPARSLYKALGLIEERRYDDLNQTHLFLPIQ
jgi:hypothetical protein